MRIVLAVVMALHGIAHMVGFAGAWQLATSTELPYKTTVLGGHLDLGYAGIRVVGVLWAMAAIAFVTVAGGAALQQAWWPTAAIVVTTASLALTFLEMPQAKIGLVLNLVLLAVLLLMQRYQWA